MAVAEARAVDRFWGNPLGGEFTDSVNWEDSTKAGVIDVAHFGLTDNPHVQQRVYTVSFSANVTNQALQIEDDFVTFDLNARTYTTRLSTGNEIGNVAGRSGRLTITDGVMNVVARNTDLFIGTVANASGALTVSKGGQITGSPFLAVGDFGTGTLTVESGGVIQGGSTLIGNAAGATGAATVTGPGSVFNGGVLSIGNLGSGTLNITSGGRVQNTTSEIGSGSSGTGVVTVETANSEWVTSGTLSVGRAGNGTLNITSGGTVTSVTGLIGDAAGSDGTLNLNSGGALTLSGDGEFIVANRGAGALNISAGSRVNLTGVGGYSRIGKDAGSTGTATVSGAGSAWTHAGVGGSIAVGYGGNGSLSVTGGGQVSHINDAVIGLLAGSTGTATIDGSGSAWTSGQTIRVGILGAGTLNITNGGQVVSDLAIIGERLDSSGAVSVNGTGSALMPASRLIVADSGTGTLDISNGGQVSGGSLGIFIGGFDDVYPDANGAVTVDGAGSTLTSPLLSLGRRGTGTLRVSGGGRVVVSGSIDVSSDPLATGTIIVEDVGSTLIAPELYVGGRAAEAGGNGRLAIAGGSANVGNLKVWAPGQVDVTGGTLDVTGTLTTVDDSVLHLDGGMLRLRNSAALQAFPHTFDWTGGTLSLTESGLTIGAGGMFGTSLALNSRMGLTLGGALNVTAGASLLSGGAVSAAGGVNDGTLSLIGGGSLSYSQPAVNNGSLDAVRATLSFPGDGIKNAIGLTNNGALTLANATIHGDVHSPTGSTINVAAGVVFNGLVSGGGNFPGAGNVTFNGGYSPGDSPAAVTFGGNVAWGPNGTLDIELGGTSAGSQYDQVHVAGDATLAGALAVDLIKRFVPVASQSFALLTYASRTGTFDTVGFPPLPAGLTWSLDYGDTALTLSVALDGDLNRDVRVDRVDLALFTAEYGTSSLADLARLQANFGRLIPPGSPGPANAVPEPGGLTLGLVGALIWASRRVQRGRFATTGFCGRRSWTNRGVGGCWGGSALRGIW